MKMNRVACSGATRSTCARSSTPFMRGIMTSQRTTSYFLPDVIQASAIFGADVEVTSNSSARTWRSDSAMNSSSSTMSTRPTRRMVPDAGRAPAEGSRGSDTMDE